MRHICLVFSWYIQRNIRAVFQMKLPLWKKVNTRITADNLRAIDYTLICFSKWNNLTKSAVIYRKYCISIFCLDRDVWVFSLLSFIRFVRLFSLSSLFSPPPLSLCTFCFIFYKQPSFSSSLSLSLSRTHARALTHTSTQHTSANRLVIQIHGCVSFHPW